MNNEIILYQSEDGQLNFDVKIDQDTVWLTQAQMAELFQATQQNISLHIQNILKDGELTLKATHKEYLSVRREGNRDVKRNLDYYNLDMIISIGYRVNSIRGTQFRIWATQILKEHLLKGYSVNKRKIEEIGTRLDLFIKEQKSINQQLLDDQAFIKKMLKPNFIIHNYIDTKPLVEASKENLAEFKDKLQELNEILKEIEKKLPATSDLKILIKDLQENASQAQENPEAQHRFLKTVSDLGDSNSSISKMLTGAGVAENLLKKVYGIATFLFKHWPF